jgi:hypothetical protein
MSDVIKDENTELAVSENKTVTDIPEATAVPNSGRHLPLFWEVYRVVE